MLKYSEINRWIEVGFWGDLLFVNNRVICGCMRNVGGILLSIFLNRVRRANVILLPPSKCHPAQGHETKAWRSFHWMLTSGREQEEEEDGSSFTGMRYSRGRKIWKPESSSTRRLTTVKRWGDNSEVNSKLFICPSRLGKYTWNMGIMYRWQKLKGIIQCGLKITWIKYCHNLKWMQYYRNWWRCFRNDTRNQCFHFTPPVLYIINQ